MKKFLTSVVAAATLLAAMVPVAQAATVSGDFTVSVTLTSKCEVTNASAPVLSFTYQAFSTSAVSSTSPIALTFRCTRGIAAPTVAFDTGTDKTSSATGATATGEGVVSGLRYTLAVAADSSSTAGAAATTSSIGSAKLLSYSVSGSMPADQAGTCADASGTCTNVTQARTLIVTY